MILTHHPDIPGRDTGLKFIGYWHRPDLPKRWGVQVRRDKDNLPAPQDYVDLTWTGIERDIIIAYLKNGQPWEQWRGESWCRFGCDMSDEPDVEMGSQDLTDGVYVWPEGLAHYLEAHSVKLDVEFIDHVMRR